MHTTTTGTTGATTGTIRRRAGCAVSAALLLALAGCGSGGDPAAGSASPSDETHRMADGTVMEGETHIDDDSDSQGESEAASKPSEAAQMVCGGSVVDDVTRIMDMDAPVEPTSAWEDPEFTCSFDLADGPLVLTVHDADERTAGMAHFQSMRTGATGAEPIKGVYSLGLPAYETSDGTVAFVREGKTLEVDATALPADDLGVDGAMTRTDVAYAVAVSVLACWTEHS